MPPKKLWTLLILYRWSPPAGIRVLHSVSPTGRSVRTIVLGKHGDATHLFPPTWSPARYFAVLDDTARILLEHDRDPLVTTLETAGADFAESVKAAVKRKRGA